MSTIADLQELIEAFTGGDWEQETVGTGMATSTVITQTTEGESYRLVGQIHSKPEERAIVALRNAAGALLDIAEAAQKMFDAKDPLGFGGYSPWECVFCHADYRTSQHDLGCEFIGLRDALAALIPQDHRSEGSS